MVLGDLISRSFWESGKVDESEGSRSGCKADFILLVLNKEHRKMYDNGNDWKLLFRNLGLGFWF